MAGLEVAEVVMAGVEEEQASVGVASLCLQAEASSPIKMLSLWVSYVLSL